MSRLTKYIWEAGNSSGNRPIETRPDALKAIVYVQKLRGLERTKARRNEVDVTQ